MRKILRDFGLILLLTMLFFWGAPRSAVLEVQMLKGNSESALFLTSYTGYFSECSSENFTVSLIEEEIVPCTTYSNRVCLVFNTINRLISINGVQIMISGFKGTYNWSWTWKDSKGETKSFDAIWIRRVSQNSSIPVDNEKYFFLSNLSFLADYNGTHYAELILNGSTSGVSSCDKVFWNRNDSFVYEKWPESVHIEYNRTEIYGNSSTSLYNPSMALLHVHRYMESRNYTYDNVTTIFLVPQSFLIDKYKMYDFVWYMILLKDVTEPGKTETLMYYQFVLSPNCSIVDVKIERLTEVPPFHECCNGDATGESQSGFSEFGIYLIPAIGIVAIIVAVTLQKRKAKANAGGSRI